MQFGHPIFLVIAVVLGATLVALIVHLGVARRRALEQLATPHLAALLTASVSRVRRRAKETMIVAGMMFFAVALARPRLGYRWEEAHRRGVDVLFAVDASKSMLTPDVKPDRLERAKLAVRDLVQHFPDDRVGLVAFAGTAFLETPLTLDHGIFEQSLEGLDTNVIPLGGTNVASALDVASKALGGEQHKKILVLLTDGEALSGDAVSAAERAAKAGMVVYTVGVGTPHGELIPLRTADGQTAFVKDANGEFVTSKLDESLLRHIATVTGGSYRPLGDNGQGLASLYREELARLPLSDLSSRSQRVPIERYQWPLGLALLLLGLEPLIGERRRSRAPRSERTIAPSPAKVTRAVAASAAAAMILYVPLAHASPQSAERAYRHGQFAAAEADYAGASKAAPDDPKLTFDVGDAAYRAGDLATATKSFESALRTPDLKLQQQAYYNLGDALYRGGERTLASGKIDDTIGAWKRSISNYGSALRLNPKDGDAQYNLDFVKRRLAELEKKRDEQKEDRQKESQKSSSKDEKSKSGKSGQSQNDKSEGGESSESKDGSNGNTSQDDHRNGKDGKAKQETASKPADSNQNKGANGQAANARQPAPSAGPQGTPQPGAIQAKGSPADDASETQMPLRPGDLSKAEARALLDSLRGDLRVAPLAPPSTNKRTLDVQPEKDW